MHSKKSVKQHLMDTNMLFIAYWLEMDSILVLS